MSELVQVATAYRQAVERREALYQAHVQQKAVLNDLWEQYKLAEAQEWDLSQQLQVIALRGSGD